MPNKRRFFAALLTALSLLSAWALAEIDLKPYEIESDRFTLSKFLRRICIWFCKTAL
ncbi:MAG: hypothetical protein ACLR07_08695 [Christensenellales bacterium]